MERLVHILKKGLCDNWRGISLLDVIGKLFATVKSAKGGRSARVLRGIHHT